MTTPILPPASSMLAVPASNITPFTYRDGLSYLQRLERLVKYINRVVLPWVQENYTQLAGSFELQVAEMVALADELRTYVESQVTDISSQVDEAEAARDAAIVARNEAEAYASGAAAIQDSAINTIINNLSSLTRTILNGLYASKATQDTVDSGRLSQTTLDAYYTAFFADDFSALNTLIGNTNTALDALESDVTDLAGEVAGVVTEIDSKLALKMSALDWRIENPSQWGANTGQALVIPTHVSPDTKQPAHPSILYFPERWNGYRYWMTYTPYPGNDDDHEDPNLAVSNDGVNWIHAPGVTQPLDDATGVPYNSDPDLVMGSDDTMYLFWRYYDGSLGSNQEKLYMRKSVDGVNWTTKELVWQYTETVLRPLSPSFIFEDGKWTVYFVDVAGGFRVFKRMVSNTDNPTAGWGAPATLTITPAVSGKEVWHVEVRRIGGGLVGIMNVINPGAGGVGGQLQLISSNDGVTWKGSAETVVPQVLTGQHNNLYRASFVPGFNDGVMGLWLYYSAYQDTPAPNVWNIFRTWLGPVGKGEPITITPGSGFTLTNVDVRKRDGWAYGTFDWSKATDLAHADIFGVLPVAASPVMNDAITILSSGVVPFSGVVAASARALQANNPPAGRTSGTVRFKIPILPS